VIMVVVVVVVVVVMVAVVEAGDQHRSSTDLGGLSVCVEQIKRASNGRHQCNV
jgi:hypothetical protein